MAKDNAHLSNKLAQQGASMTPLAIQQQLSIWKGKHWDKLEGLAGDKKTADKVYTICMNTIARNPALLSCDFSSIANCILQSFQLGVYPGVEAGCAYVPLNNSKTGRKEAQFWLQYQGLVKLLRNAGNKAIVARVVFENDYFEYYEGHKSPVYAPAVVCGKKRGKPLFAYAAVCTNQDMWQVEVMSPEQIESIKNRSMGARFNDSPWNSKHEDDVYVMWAKTVLKRVSKWCTKSAELVQAIESDNEIEGDEQLRRPKIIDIQDEPMTEPEVIPQQLSAPQQEYFDLPNIQAEKETLLKK